MGLGKYETALKSLMPPGKIWQSDDLGRLLSGLSQSIERLERYVTRRLRNDFVKEFTKFVGMGYAISDQTSRSYRDILERFSNYQVTIYQLEPSRVGLPIGAHLAGEDWSFVIFVDGIRQDRLDEAKSVVKQLKPAHLHFEYRSLNG
jgi:hypothetical protein